MAIENENVGAEQAPISGQSDQQVTPPTPPIEDKKSSKKWVWIVVIVVVVLALISIGAYFLLFSMSESKAREIIRIDYYNNPSDVCSKFFVSGDKCPSFMDCYVDKAIAQMPENLLIQFAKDIKKGKSSAIDSHSLINGKKIGEGCLSFLK